MKDAALCYARLGLPVFPCGKNKTPLIKDWPNRATSDIAQVESWWNDHPEAMVGLLTGSKSGILVLDVDVDKKTGEPVGMRTLEKIGLGEMARVSGCIRTPSGGYHYYFRYPDFEVRNSVKQLGAGLDIRGDGGYVIAAGSHNGNGLYEMANPFTFENLTDLPETLIARLSETKSSRPTAAATGEAVKAPVPDDAMAAEILRVRMAEEGERNETLNKASFAVGRLVHARKVDEQKAWEHLLSAALETGLPEKEARRTIKSGLDAGKASPGLALSADEAFGGPAPALSEGPQPLVRDLPEAQPYPVEALGPLSVPVKAVQGMTQAPVAIPAQSALSVASLVVQGFADVETLGGNRPVSLFCLTVAQSGERKSSCDAPLMQEVQEHVRAQMQQHRGERARWKNRHDVWKRRRDAIIGAAKKSGDHSGEMVQSELDNLGLEPVEPPSPERIVTEPTFEGLTRLYSEGQPSLGIFSDEGGQFLGGHAMNSDNRQKTSTALNGVWQGEPIKRTRQGDGSQSLFGRRLSMHLMVQPNIAQTFLSDRLAVESGFLPRFLVCHPPSTMGTRLQAKTKVGEFELIEFKTRLKHILGTPMPMDEQTRELKPRRLRLEKDARALLSDYSDQVELELKPNGAYASVTGFASKSAEQAARIAGVLTLWQDLDAQSVSGETMRNAIILAQYYLEEARRITNAAVVSSEIDRAEKLRKWLLESWQHAEIIPSEVVQHGPNALRVSKIAKAAMSVLAQHGWLQRLPAGTCIRGRARQEAYRIVRG